ALRDQAGLRLALASSSSRANRAAPGPATDVFGSQLPVNTNLGRFRYDGLPLDRPPWQLLGNNGSPANPGWGVFSNQGVAARIVGKPSAAQDPVGVGAIAWTERITPKPGQDT